MSDNQRPTPDQIDSLIIGELYLTPGRNGETQYRAKLEHVTLITQSLSCLTICILITIDGKTLVGSSVSESREEFDLEYGRKASRADAWNKVLLTHTEKLRST